MRSALNMAIKLPLLFPGHHEYPSVTWPSRRFMITYIFSRTQSNRQTFRSGKIMMHVSDSVFSKFALSFWLRSLGWMSKRCAYQTSPWLLTSDLKLSITWSRKSQTPSFCKGVICLVTKHGLALRITAKEDVWLTLKPNATETPLEHAGKQAGLFCLPPMNCLKQNSKLLNNVKKKRVDAGNLFFFFFLHHSALKSSPKLFHQKAVQGLAYSWKETRDQMAMLMILKLGARKVCQTWRLWRADWKSLAHLALPLALFSELNLESTKCGPLALSASNTSMLASSAGTGFGPGFWRGVRLRALRGTSVLSL